MNKIISAFTFLAICATLTGCSKDTPKSAPSTTAGTAESTTSVIESATTTSATSATAATPTPEQELISVTSDDMNKATVSVSDIEEVNGNKQVAYVADVNGLVKVINYYVFDSEDKFAYSYLRIEANPNVSVSELVSTMDDNNDFSTYTEVEPNVWHSPYSYPSEETDGVPLYSNGVQYAKGILHEMANMFNAMRDAGYVSDDGDIEISVSGDLDFSDAEVYVYGEETSEDVSSDTSSTTVVEEGNTYAGSSLTLANPYAINPDGMFDLESYILTVNAGETVALPINSLPDGDVTFSLSEPCAALIYNGELTLKGLYEGSTNLMITASNGKTGYIMIMVQ